jgi:hypothetical protein
MLGRLLLPMGSVTYSATTSKQMVDIFAAHWNFHNSFVHNQTIDNGDDGGLCGTDVDH